MSSKLNNLFIRPVSGDAIVLGAVTMVCWESYSDGTELKRKLTVYTSQPQNTVWKLSSGQESEQFYSQWLEFWSR